MQIGSHLRFILATTTAVVLAVLLPSPLSPLRVSASPRLPSPLSASPPSPWSAPRDTQGAKAFLAAMLRDSNTTAGTLAALRLTSDAELAPLYAAYAAHSNRQVRLVCSTSLADLKGPQAVAALLERAKSEPLATLRAQAVAILVQSKAATAAQLLDLMKGDDENVQYLCARGLVSMGQGALAADKLAQLAESKDPSTSGLARLDLLGLGHAHQLEPVGRILADPNTPPLTAGMMLERIYEDKNAALAPFVEKVAVSAPAEDVRLHALRALAAVSPDASGRLLEALDKTDKTAARVLVFRMLAGLKDAAPHLKSLADGNDLLAALARFELARPAVDAASAKAAAEVMAFEHPIIIEHVLASLRDDLAKEANLPTASPGRMDVYSPALLAVLRKAPKESEFLGGEQEACARAATLLGDIGGPAALAGLKEVLSGPFGEAKRAAVGGLVRTKNPAAAGLLKPVLDSPYPELSATSAIALARQGDKDASRTLQDILVHSHRYSPELVAMVAWYSLKLSGEQAAALQELVGAAK